MRSHSFKGCAYAAVAAWALVVAGCGGPELMPTPNLYTMTDDNPFPDVPPALRTSTVDVIYATDRVPEGDVTKDPRYGVGRSKSLAFGLIRDTLGIARRFFDLREGEKRAIEMVHSRHFRGYTRPGREFTRGEPDWREQLDVGGERPALPPEAKASSNQKP